MEKKDVQSDVEQRIMAVAKELFVKSGYNKTTIRDIATMSSTNVAMVNYYFGSKYNLFEIIFEDAVSVLISRIFSAVNSDLSFFDLIEQWVNSYYDTFLEYPQIPVFIINEINIDPEGLTKRIQKKNVGEVYIKLTGRIEQEVNCGNIRQIESIDLVLNVLSLCVFPFMLKDLAVSITDSSIDDFYKELERHKKGVVEFIINALKL